MIGFALSSSFWYATFQVHSDITDVSFLSDSQMSVVLGEHLIK